MILEKKLCEGPVFKVLLVGAVWVQIILVRPPPPETDIKITIFKSLEEIRFGFKTLDTRAL